MTTPARLSGPAMPHNFERGWARMPFRGTSTHYFRPDPVLPWVHDPTHGPLRVYESLCKHVKDAVPNLRVPMLGPGNTTLCRSCQRAARVMRIPEPTAAERGTFVEHMRPAP